MRTKVLEKSPFKLMRNITSTLVSMLIDDLHPTIIGLMLKCQPPKISRGGCSLWVTQFLRKTQHLASPGMEFLVKLNNGYHVGLTNE